MLPETVKCFYIRPVMKSCRIDAQLLHNNNKTSALGIQLQKGD